MSWHHGSRSCVLRLCDALCAGPLIAAEVLATGRVTQTGQASAATYRHPPVARKAVAQGVASGAGVGEGVAMPQQVVTVVEGSSSRQGGRL